MILEDELLIGEAAYRKKPDHSFWAMRCERSNWNPSIHENDYVYTLSSTRIHITHSLSCFFLILLDSAMVPASLLGRLFAGFKPHSDPE